MASPAKITEVLPDTLPEDFGEWDGSDSPAGQPAPPEAAPGFGVVPKPATQPAETHAAAPPSGNLLRGAAMPTSGTEYVDDAAFLHRVRSLSPATDRTREVAVQRQAAAPAIDEARFSAPRPAAVAAPAVVRKPAPAAPAPQAAAMTEADEILFHSFRAGAAETKEAKPAKKKWPIIAGASGALAVILAAVMVPLLHHGQASAAKSVVPPQPTVTVIQQPEDGAAKPSPETPSTSAATKPAASSDSPDASDAQPAAADQGDAGPSQAQAQMMNDQLSAPARIQRTQTASAEQAPPPPGGFGVSGMDGLNNGNAVGSVFNNERPKVEAALPKVVNVSAGVAVGLLIQKTTPIYPQIAKAARVSGTVVLQANIFKAGTIQNLHVVSGPMMLRQAAVDAVRTWRYKPYKLNNQPTEIQTTINVIFSLNG